MKNHKKQLKEIYTQYKWQIKAYNCGIQGNPVEKIFPMSSTQKLHLSVGTHNLELVIPFDTILNKKLLDESVSHLIRKQGLLRSILVNQKGQVMWQQHACLNNLRMPFLDISEYHRDFQDTILLHLVKDSGLKRFPTHSILYRMLVVKAVLLMYLKKYLKPTSCLFRMIVKISRMTQLLPKNCRGNGLLYQMVLVKRNLRDHVLLIRLDHIIGDDTSMEIIRNYIYQYYETAGRGELPEVVPYHQFVQQVNMGPIGIRQEELHEHLEVKDYQYYASMITHYIDQRNTKKVYLFHYEYPYNNKENLDEEKAWEISFILVHLMCKELFGIPKIASKLLYYGRNYGGKSFFNTVGEFWDLLPMLIEVDEEEPLNMSSKASHLVDLSGKYNINYSSLFLDDGLYETWKGIINLVAPARLIPPESMILIDFLGKKMTEQGKKGNSMGNATSTTKASDKKHLKEEYINVRSQGGFLIFVHYTEDSIWIDVESIIKIDAPQLKRALDKKADKVLTRINW
jgi:hypothetical protein